MSAKQAKEEARRQRQPDEGGDAAVVEVHLHQILQATEERGKRRGRIPLRSPCCRAAATWIT